MNWSLIVSIFALVISILAATAASITAYTSRQQFAALGRPKLVVGNVHFWEEGKGGPLKPNNPVPVVAEGMRLQGSAFATNTGQRPAKIIQSYCMFYWSHRPLPMNNPGWMLSSSDEFKVFDWQKADHPFLQGQTSRIIEPGDAARCEFSGVAGTGNLYVLGGIVYLDEKLDHRHSVIFARQYIPMEERFVAVTDKNYEDAP